MTTVYHPSIPGITRQVDDKAVDKWAAAGWRKSEPKAVREARKADEAAK